MHCTFFIHSSADGHLGSANIVLAPLMCLAWLQAPGLNQELKAKSSAALSDLHSQSRQGLPAVCPPIQLGTCIQAIFLPTTGPLHVTFLHLKCSLEPLYLTASDSPQLPQRSLQHCCPSPGQAVHPQVARLCCTLTIVLPSFPFPQEHPSHFLLTRFLASLLVYLSLTLDPKLCEA